MLKFTLKLALKVYSALCGVRVTPHSAVYTQQIGLDIICRHIAEIFINDVLQLNILMIITLAKHKFHTSWWWLFKPKHVAALLMLILM